MSNAYDLTDTPSSSSASASRVKVLKKKQYFNVKVWNYSIQRTQLL